MLSSRRISQAVLLAYPSLFCGLKSIVYPTTTIVPFVVVALPSSQFKHHQSSSSSSSLYSSVSSRRTMSSTTCAATTATTGNFEIVQIPCLSDNYGYLIHDITTGQTAAVDTPDATPYRKILQERGWKLTHIFNTHHHWDHTGGNTELINTGANVVVYGPAIEKAKIPGITKELNDGDTVPFGSSIATILDVGGHTVGHIAYYFPQEEIVFVGDSLFALGCGRMFEGTPTQFWTSLQKLRTLPDTTTVYCAHEYTESNAKFAASIEPGNKELMERIRQIIDARKDGIPTVPSNLGIEKRTNPFLRCDISNEIRTNVGVVPGESDAEAFAKVRKAKDTFRG